jgi:hypothetical protein
MASGSFSVQKVPIYISFFDAANEYRRILGELPISRLQVLSPTFRADLEAFCTPRTEAPFWPWQSEENTAFDWLTGLSGECYDLLRKLNRVDPDDANHDEIIQDFKSLYREFEILAIYAKQTEADRVRN